MSHKGNDLVRAYLWNAARVGIRHNPAVRALYRRLKAKGKRGDVALGHCMRKLLHLVFAVWKTNRPFDEQHFPWEPRQPALAAEQSCDSPMSLPMPPVAAPTNSSNDEAVGHKRDVPAEKVVTTAFSTVKSEPAVVKPRPQVDFIFLRQQVTLEQVLRHLGLFEQLRGQGPQRRGRCPLHAQLGDSQRTFSAHLGKNVFQCFDASCAAQGNVLDLWAALHRLPIYEAALHLAETFHLAVNREEEPVL
jgi:CHC2 zinc finger